MAKACVVLCMLVARSALAQPNLEPDAEAAKRHYEVGQAAYDRSEYARAIDEFRVAQQLHPVPELEYDIARCLDRLERWAEAADAYERFLGANAAFAEASALRARISLLRARVEPRRHARGAPGWVAGVVGGVGLASAVAGAGTLIWARTRYDAIDASGCAPRCDPASVDPLRSGQLAGWVLVGTGAALGVTGLVLWLTARPRAGRARALIDGAVRF